ncbi:hypothetical protein OG306_32115 [Streptomyces sp. NBC_01241]|uniref:hypothetical protein n=1 Tax=unclassified Streptomyces TaxID=2593676 RepID=UPI00225B935A|nr:hypothetical protein [Streptomyces sp. NBC_01221]WSP58513.1 hypothetical protein OG306_32115 [Streptomyces sp. NBC_01241]
MNHVAQLTFVVGKTRNAAACNDENVQGGATALENAGFKADDVIGAYLARKNWSSGKLFGMKATLFINGSDVGALAVQTMYDKLTEHRTHEGHDHRHEEGCGHVAVPHDDHVDYVHDGHRHAFHEGHWDDP